MARHSSALSQADATDSEIHPLDDESTRATARDESLQPVDVDLGRILRRARQHHGFSLREVERRTGRTNAYLSQVERGVIRRPDPLCLLELSDLYRLDFVTLASWAGLASHAQYASAGSEALRALIRLAMDMEPHEQLRLLSLAESLTRTERT